MGGRYGRPSWTHCATLLSGHEGNNDCYQPYENNSENEEIVASFQLNSDHSIHLCSVATGINHKTKQSEIIVAANAGSVQDELQINQGFLFILEVDNKWPILKQTIPINANFVGQTLRTTTGTDKGSTKIYAAGFRKRADLYFPYILGWDLDGTVIVNHMLSDKGFPRKPSICIDIGYVSEMGSPVFVIGMNEAHSLLLYTINEGNLEQVSKYNLDENIHINNIHIVGNTMTPNDNCEIVLYGGIRDHLGDGSVGYIDILEYADGFKSKWRKIGICEKEVLYATVGSNTTIDS